MFSVAIEWVLKPLLPKKRNRIYTVLTLGVIILLGYIYAIYYLNNSEGIITQKGESHIFQAGEIDIFYPIKYNAPPNLKVSYNSEIGFRIIEQRPDGFKIEVHSLGLSNDTSPSLKWESSGKQQKD